jgi:hypothetical protein
MLPVRVKGVTVGTRIPSRIGFGMFIFSCLYSRKNQIKGLPSLLIAGKEDGRDL